METAFSVGCCYESHQDFLSRLDFCYENHALINFAVVLLHMHPAVLVEAALFTSLL